MGSKQPQEEPKENETNEESPRRGKLQRKATSLGSDFATFLLESESQTFKKAMLSSDNLLERGCQKFKKKVPTCAVVVARSASASSLDSDSASVWNLVECAASEDGRTKSIWDTFVDADLFSLITWDCDCGHGGATADVSCEAYHKIQDGKGPVNPKGLQYYNNLIDEIEFNHMLLYVTVICHKYLKTNMQMDESKDNVDDFTAYVDVCFKEFGDRVLHWNAFLNEVNVFTLGGYDNGMSPPNHCSRPFGMRPYVPLPEIWSSPFRMDVSVYIVYQCQNNVRPVIKDNYVKQYDFWFELDHTQSSKFISQLSSLAYAPSIPPHYPAL
nr:beta-glucosidase 31-like [Solanum lycopersicum]